MYGHLSSLRNVSHPAEKLAVIVSFFLNPLFPALLALRYILCAAWWLVTDLWSSKRRYEGQMYVAAAMGTHALVKNEDNEVVTSVELGWESECSKLESHPRCATRYGIAQWSLYR